MPQDAAAKETKILSRAEGELVPVHEARYLSALRATSPGTRSASASAERRPLTGNLPAQIVGYQGAEHAIFPPSSESSYVATSTHNYRPPSHPMQRPNPHTEFLYHAPDAANSSNSPSLESQLLLGRYVLSEEAPDPEPIVQESPRVKLQKALGIASDDNAKSSTNLNQRYDYLPDSMIPFWYKKESTKAAEGKPNDLCATCRHIDFLALFEQEETDVMPKPSDFTVLGTISNLTSRIDCGFCKLVMKVVYADIGSTLPLDMAEAERARESTNRLAWLLSEQYYLCPIRFQTTFGEPVLYILSGDDIAEALKQKSAIRPRASMAIKPMHVSAPNLGLG
ncbi:hypothetical protein LTR37_003873, partial [Vermiconidia calcicola]